MLAHREANGLWGADLPQTREEFFRLFLAQAFLARARTDAIAMAQLSSKNLFSFLLSIHSFVGLLRDLPKFLPQIEIWQTLIEHQESLLLTMEANTVSLVEENYTFILTQVTKIAPIVLLDAQKEKWKFIGKLAKYASGKAFNKLFAEALTEEFLSLQARIWITPLIHEMIDNFEDYDKGVVVPRDAQSLVNSFDQVKRIQIGLQTDVANAAVDTRIHKVLSGWLSDANFALSGVIWGAAATGLGLPAAGVLKVIEKVSTGVQNYWNFESFKLPMQQLFLNIPRQIGGAVDAAFDRPARNLLARTDQAFTTELAPRKSQVALSGKIAQAFEAYRIQLDSVRAAIQADNIKLAVDRIMNNVIPASEHLNLMLDRANGFIRGGTETAFQQQAPDVETGFQQYAQKQMAFNAARLPLPWHMLFLGELDRSHGGVHAPEYESARDDLLALLQRIQEKSMDFENFLTMMLDDYASRGFLKATAIVDSAWVTVDGSPSNRISKTPASLKVHARVQNLSSIGVTGLNLILRGATMPGLSFSAGVDSILQVVDLQPDDAAPGGADEFTGTWSLTYDGSPGDERSLAFLIQLRADSTNISTGTVKSVLIDLVPPDSDGDGMPDDYEISVGLDPQVQDSRNDDDADGLKNGQEFLFGTDPHRQDSDGDGIVDGAELQQ
ncbi:MAG: hypothetical protein D6814_03015, partial [Calditrichaeota bacterium]